MSSYADIAAENAPPKSEQPKPDPGYLEGPNPHAHDSVNAQAPDVNSSKVNVVPSDSDLEHLKTQSQEAYDEAVAKAREQRKQLESDAKKAADEAQKKGEQVANDAQKKGEKLAGDAQKAGKEVANEAEKFGKDARAEAQKAGKKAEEYFEKGKKEVQKDAEYLRKKGEEGAKRVKKAAGEAEKELESWWDQFSRDPKQWGPALAGLNAVLLGGLGIYAYTNKEQVQRTDKRLLSAATVGVLALLGGQYTWASETARKQNRGL
ncbi:hypothetical protein BCV70DRAFT_198293 [Testicularia cyperi]|uniref:Mitochondrial outer membrane protein OM14 C-terminal domain-containing protein n=1 Tax=Testicularia cyperi TaxID=1882483 RepID=A0A317XXH7_9BASI|nr:hypothetical protein BCV70DRAFT_198293 [Testicularia cyperi]